MNENDDITFWIIYFMNDDILYMIDTVSTSQIFYQVSLFWYGISNFFYAFSWLYIVITLKIDVYSYYTLLSSIIFFSELCTLLYTKES